MEWDDAERDKMAALAMYEDGVCQCGLHHSVTRNPDTFYEFPIDRCPVCADIAVKARTLKAADDAELEKRRGPARGGEEPRELPPEAPRPDDGRHIGLRLLTEDEVEQRRAAIEQAKQQPQRAGRTK